MQTAALSIVAPTTDTAAYLATFEQAAERASFSNFDVHVIRNADGSYWYADEGDYNLDISSFMDRIVHTIDGRMSGRY